MSFVKKNVVVVGCGRIGNVHIRNVLANPRLSLIAVVDVDEKLAKQFAEIAGCPHYSSVDPVLKLPNLDAVIITTPTAQHTEIILKSLRAGKPVMCEKPISLKIEEIDLCYEESKKLGVPLLCAYQRRHDESFVKLRNAVHQGTIGKLQYINSTARDNPVPTIAYLKISGGIFHDCGSHDIDVLRWVSGEDPTEIYAAASCFNPEIKAINDFDTVLMTLKFPSGTIGTINLSRKAAYGYDQRIEVLGDKGMIQANNQQPTSTLIATEDGIHADPFQYTFIQRYAKTYAAELDHFVDILHGKAQPKLTHDDVRKVSIIADAAEESARSGKPVTIKY